MKLAVEVFGKGAEIELGWGLFSLTVGRLLDVLYDPNSITRGRQWLDWLSHEHGSLEIWMGHRHVSLDWGPARDRWFAAKAEAQVEAFA